MPNNLGIDNETRARRHVLSQQMYRLRLRYRLLHNAGIEVLADSIKSRLEVMSVEYESLGGKPIHKGNLL